MAPYYNLSNQIVRLNNAHIDGSSLTIHGDGNTITAHYSKIHGNGNVVSGSSACVTGNNNVITSDYADVYGSGNTVDGRSTKTTGNNNRVMGEYAKATGNHNEICGRSAKANGNNNRVTGEYAEATGSDNTVRGRRAKASGNNNSVTGEYARATGRNNTINGVAAEVAIQQQQQHLQQQRQYYDQLTQQAHEQYMEYMMLCMEQQLMQGNQSIQSQLENARRPFIPAQSLPPQQTRLERPIREQNNRQIPEQPAASARQQKIELVLRGEDSAVDENGQECYVCYDNTAVVASVCCGKLVTCLKCTRTLYEGKWVGQAKCINCRGDVSHVVRIS